MELAPYLGPHLAPYLAPGSDPPPSPHPHLGPSPAPTWRSDCGQGRAGIPRRGNEDDTMLVDELVHQLYDAPAVGCGCRLPIAHVDEVTLVLKDGDDGAREAGAGLHGAQPRVPDLTADDLSAWGAAGGDEGAAE